MIWSDNVLETCNQRNPGCVAVAALAPHYPSPQHGCCLTVEKRRHVTLQRCNRCNSLSISLLSFQFSIHSMCQLPHTFLCLTIKRRISPNLTCALSKCQVFHWSLHRNWHELWCYQPQDQATEGTSHPKVADAITVGDKGSCGICVQEYKKFPNGRAQSQWTMGRWSVEPFERTQLTSVTSVSLALLQTVLHDMSCHKAD